jgi:hypothetical protein
MLNFKTFISLIIWPIITVVLCFEVPKFINLFSQTYVQHITAPWTIIDINFGILSKSDRSWLVLHDTLAIFKVYLIFLNIRQLLKIYNSSVISRVDLEDASSRTNFAGIVTFVFSIHVYLNAKTLLDFNEQTAKTINCFGATSVLILAMFSMIIGDQLFKQSASKTQTSQIKTLLIVFIIFNFVW